MAISATTVTALERDLLDAARGGDQDAYRRLVEPHRRALHAHCYRMLGSVHDAEDALQDALLRAWRGLPRFEGRSSLRSWLYRIATNACLNAIERRPKRMLPIDHGPPADPHDHAGRPLVESTWVEPYPDERLGLEDGRAAPEARYERREGVELAFVAALQHLPPNQRAALILREVLGFSGQEIAEALETTVAAVNSALQRARRTVDERLPDAHASRPRCARSATSACARSSRATWTPWRAATSTPSSACWRRTPCGRCRRWAAWYRGRDEIAVFLATAPLNGEWRWRHLPARASGQAAVGSYVCDARDEHHRAVRARRADPARRADRRDHVVHRRARRGCATATASCAGPTTRPTPARAGRVLRALRPARPPGLSYAAARRAAEARARAADQRLGAADRDVQAAGDRLVRGAAELVGDERDALALGQALELADQVAQVVGAHDLLVRVGAGVAQHGRVRARGRSCAPAGAARRACGCARS